MPEYNKDIRAAIRGSRLKQYEVAREINVHPTTLCSWLSFGELSAEKKQRIFAAIEKIRND